MSITLVAAVARNGVIGVDGRMPWHLPGELRHFKALTMGHPMVMGRRTFDSIGRALPGRRTIVVTRDAQWTAEGVETAPSVPAALQLAGADSEEIEVMVVGGGEIYAATIDSADRLEITDVDLDVAGDVRFPAIAPADWERTGVDRQPGGYSFVSYRRRPAPITDLAQLLAGLRPELHSGDYVFCSVPPGFRDLPAAAVTVVTVAEAEGYTLVLPVQAAESAGLPFHGPMAWITLKVHSSLAAVGLTAAVSAALAADGIACNMVAGYHHDHVFVPSNRAHDAIQALTALAHTRS